MFSFSFDYRTKILGPKFLRFWCHVGMLPYYTFVGLITLTGNIYDCTFVEVLCQLPLFHLRYKFTKGGRKFLSPIYTQMNLYVFCKGLLVCSFVIVIKETPTSFIYWSLVFPQKYRIRILGGLKIWYIYIKKGLYE